MGSLIDAKNFLGLDSVGAVPPDALDVLFISWVEAIDGLHGQAVSPFLSGDWFLLPLPLL